MKKSNKLATALVSIVVVVLGIWAGMQIFYKNMTDIASVPKPTPSIKQLPAPKKGWKWYISPHNVAFQYPAEFTPNESGEIFTSGTKEFRVLIDDTTPNGVAPALEPASSQVVINNITWNIKNSYTYCDAGICSPTGVTYYIYQDRHLVRVKYFPDDMWPITEQVISSIVFNAQ